MSIILAPVFFASSTTLLGVLIYVVSFLSLLRGALPAFPGISPVQPGARKLL
jgi:hypothetical protein